MFGRVHCFIGDDADDVDDGSGDNKTTTFRRRDNNDTSLVAASVTSAGCRWGDGTNDGQHHLVSSRHRHTAIEANINVWMSDGQATDDR
jgi:hypothetical protein